MEYSDSSFLCGVYRVQENHLTAKAYRAKMRDPLIYTSLLEFEFMQAARLQVFLHGRDRTRGFTRTQADKIVAQWHADVAGGLLQLVPYDAEAVTKLALAYSNSFSAAGGHRSFDILHVATAVHLGARSFLTFDVRQKALAKAVGLHVPF